jgi:hypothetical protein
MAGWLRRFLQIALSLLSAFSVHAYELTKLDCQMAIERSNTAGRVYRVEEDVIFEVVEIKTYRSINSNNSEFPGVYSTKREGATSIVDLSDENKWFLINELKVQEANIAIHVNIDRNSGAIFYSKRYLIRGGTVEMLAKGRCKKLDLNTRKF